MQTNTTENVPKIIEKLQEKVKDESEIGEVVRSRRIDSQDGKIHGCFKEQKQMIGYPPVPVWADDDKVTYSGYWERIRRSGIPSKYFVNESKGFDWSLYGSKYEKGIKSVKQTLDSYVNGFEVIENEEKKTSGFRPRGMGLYINSLSHGSGKTLLGCVMACEIMKKFNNVAVKYITVPDYLELMKDKGDQRREKNWEYRDCTLLVLDEMGDGKTDWSKGTLKNLVLHRMNQQKPIIYISSYPVEKLTGDSQMTALIKAMSYEIDLPPVNIRQILEEQKKRKLLEMASSKENNEKEF